MSWNNGGNNNGGGYGQGGYQQRPSQQPQPLAQQGFQVGGQTNQPKIPEPGRGRLRPPKTRTEKSPQFRGLVNIDGHVVSIAIWYQAAAAGQNGQMMPESFSVQAETYNPNAPPRQPQQPHGGYQPAPPQSPQGYQPAPQGGFQGAPQQRQPQGYQQPQQQPMNYGDPNATFQKDEVPF